MSLSRLLTARLAVFCFTFASHGNCSQVCYSPAVWTCGLACLAGRRAALLARFVCAGAGHSGLSRPVECFGGGCSGEGPPICGILVGLPTNGISSGYWKRSGEGFQTEVKTSVSQRSLGDRRRYSELALLSRCQTSTSAKLRVRDTRYNTFSDL